MNFVSIVGSQVMAVLNSLLALASSGERPDTVSLLATEKTIAEAEKIRSFLIDGNHYSSERVKLIRVSDTLVDTAFGKAAHHVAADLQKDESIVYNLSGGMNFQIAAAMLVLDPDRCSYVYPEASRINLYKLNASTASLLFLALPAAVDVLGLQGISYQESVQPAPSFLVNLINNFKTYLSWKALQPLIIEDIEFVDVRNHGNRLKLLAVIPVGKGQTVVARKFLDLAVKRDALKGLYDRSIGVLTDSAEVVERLKSESGGKITVIDATGGFKSAAEQLNRFYDELPPLPTEQAVLPVASTGNSSANRVRLYVPLGTNIMPTLTAVWSHIPYHVCFLYTPDVPEIIRLRDMIYQERSRLPVAEISFQAVSLGAEEICSMEHPGDDWNIEVNITPGNKLQGALLAHWAKKCGGQVYSINNATLKSESLSGGKSRSLRVPPPETYLILKGEKLLPLQQGEPKTGTSLLKSSRDRTIYDFMQLATSEGIHLKSFPMEKIRTEKLQLDCNRQKGFSDVHIKNGGSAKIVWADDKGDISGFWFEPIAGYALAKAGLEGVQVSVATRYSETLEKQHLARHGITTPKSEMDVVFWYQNSYHLVSCKAMSKKNIEKHIADAKGQAAIWGRFSVPFIAFALYDGEPYEFNGVHIFGYRTYTHPEALTGFIEKAVKGRSSTMNYAA